jgi:chromosomal replication initiation ATPase DnaA
MQWLVMKFYNDRMSYPLVGRIFKRDHTSILHACRKIDRLLAANDPSVADVRDILENNGVKA